MADQQDHLMAATGADVDDAPAPAAPPSAIVIFGAVQGGDLNDPASYMAFALRLSQQSFISALATSQLALSAERRSLPLIGRCGIKQTV